MAKRSKTGNSLSRTLRLNNRRHLTLDFQALMWGDEAGVISIFSQDPNNVGQLGPVLYSSPIAGLSFEDLAESIQQNGAFGWVEKVEVRISLKEGEPAVLIDLIGDHQTAPVNQRVFFIQSQFEGENGIITSGGIILPNNGRSFIEVSVPEHVCLSAQSLKGEFISFPETPDGFKEGFSFPTPGIPEISNNEWIPEFGVFSKPSASDPNQVYLPATFVVPPGSDVVFHALVNRDTKWLKTRKWPTPQRDLIDPFDGTSSSS